MAVANDRGRLLPGRGHHLVDPRDEQTHIEPVRYPPGSNAMGTLTTIPVDGGGRAFPPGALRLPGAAPPGAFLRSMSVRRWSQRA